MFLFNNDKKIEKRLYQMLVKDYTLHTEVAEMLISSAAITSRLNESSLFHSQDSDLFSNFLKALHLSGDLELLEPFTHNNSSLLEVLSVFKSEHGID